MTRYIHAIVECDSAQELINNLDHMAMGGWKAVGHLLKRRSCFGKPFYSALMIREQDDVQTNVSGETGRENSEQTELSFDGLPKA